MSAMKLLRAFFAPLCLALVCAFLPGCKTLRVNAGVLMAVTGVTVQSDDTAVLDISLHNENLSAFAVRDTRHKVTINGVAYGLALSTKPFGLPESGDARLEATLKLADAAAAAQLRQALASGTVTYALDSELHCELGEYELVLNAEASGQLATH